MESLESKLERLTPLQRQEVEDFVDFLLSRSGMIRDIPRPLPVTPPLNGAPPPLTLIEPVHIAMGIPYHEPEHTRKNSENSSSVYEEPSGDIQEIAPDNDDRLDHDYIDYGKFEKPSPATEAVMKVKEKIVRRHEQEKNGHILEWID